MTRQGIKREVPNNGDAEEMILGAIVTLGSRVYTEVAEILRPNDFYRDKHQRIFEAMGRLERQGSPIDMILLDECLSQDESDDPITFSYLSDLSHRYFEGEIADRSAVHYAKIVRNLSVLRQLIFVGSQIASLGFEENEGDQALAKAEQMLHNVFSGKQVGKARDITEITGDYLERLEALHKQFQAGVISGVPTGFFDLDRMLGGFQQSDLITLAARPGRGKTALMMSFARKVMHYVTNSGRSYKTLVFSLEMSGFQLAQRLVSMETGIDQSRMRIAAIDNDEWETIVNAHDAMPQSRLWVDDTAGLTIADIRRRARSHQMEYGLDFVIVDYMQLLTATMSDGKAYKDRLQEVSCISRELKMMAKELDVPVLALAQLSRAVESRATKVPQLSDLRESGTIEQDSDIVMFLHKDEEAAKELGADESKGEIITLSVAKHRNGPVGQINLFFRRHLTRFDGYDAHGYVQQ